MASCARGQRHERVAFSFTRNGFKTVFIEDSGFCEECECEEFELMQSEDKYDELFNEIIFGYEC
jgi:hypothetical protein